MGELLTLLNWGSDRQNLLIWLSGLLVAMFLDKPLVALGINYLIIYFEQPQQIHLQSGLIHT